ncbi:hypothetical protein PRK78_005605 [Emydomyces testavorans]|uniref:Ubiquitin-like domain-containing protein n=1 Tax=Emydomyces testavorans TaxID=2070801 RepID=A0AAF0DJY3_9EURO|nr:hypothetical protein PRK78_005605 [Emydomyces testavorans]
MGFNITIDHATSHSSDHSSLSDEEDSSDTGVEVSPPSTGSHEYHDPYDVGGPWDHLSYPDELKPSDSASRPRTSHYHHASVNGNRARSTRRQSTRRHATQDRESLPHRSRRHHTPQPPAEPESEDSSGEYIEYPPGPPGGQYWPPVAPVPPAGYAHSAASVPSYGHYPHGNPANGAVHLHGLQGMPSTQLVQLSPMGHMSPISPMSQYGVGGPYPYGPGFPPGPGHPMAEGYFGNSERHHSPPPPHNRHRRSRSHSGGQRDDDSPPSPTLAHPAPHRLTPRFPGAPFVTPGLVPFHPHSGYFHYGRHYALPSGMMPPHFFHPYHPVPSPAQQPEKEKTPPPPPPPPAPPQPDPKDEAIARLEKLIIDERMDREAREAAREAALEKAARDKAAAEERAAAEKKIAKEAAAKATAIARAEAQVEAEKLKAEAKAEVERLKAEAEQLAAEEAAKAKKAAEEAAIAVAEAAAAATAAANKPPPEKKKPVKFKDAVGRKFSFPFHLCKTWQGMEELIRQAFLHIDGIGQHVADGHYDLVGPNGDIILPQVWETVVEPDWTITMLLWPMAEKPKEADPPPPPEEGLAVLDVGQPGAGVSNATFEETGAEPPPPPFAPRKARPAPIPGAFAMWMTGSRAKPVRSLKVEKKA